MVADDRVSGTDADRHDDLSRNGSSEFGGSADSAEMGDLGDVVGESANIARALGSGPAADLLHRPRW